METRLYYDNNQKELAIHAKEHFVSDDNVVLSIKAKLDTVNGNAQGKLVLCKKFFAERANPWYTRADVGASYSTTTDEVMYGVGVRKNFELSPEGLLSLDLKGGFQMSGAQKKQWKGKVELSQKVFNFTEDQDIKFKLGYDIPQRKPYAQVKENNWTFNLDFTNNWSLTYDL